MSSYWLGLELPSGSIFNLKFHLEGTISINEILKRWPNLKFGTIKEGEELTLWFHTSLSKGFIDTAIHILERDNKIKFTNAH